ncbi:MAG: threonine aldolase family protein, partial [Actinomycetota bacterium]
EAGLAVPPGVMANPNALRLHPRGGGHHVATETRAHVATPAVATSAMLSGIAYRLLQGDARGQVTPAQVEEALAPDVLYDVDVVDTLSLENTFNAAGGTVMDPSQLRAIRAVTDRAGVPIHLDGARLFNAEAAAGVDATAWTSQVATVQFCLSKGLGAPIGSMLCGPADLLREGRRLKILFGGAWRQAGVLAAAGLLALEHGPGRLHEDHARARRLAEGIAERSPGSVDPASVETNMVFVDTQGALGLGPLDVAARLADRGIGATVIGGRLRLVTHLDVDDATVDLVLATWPEVVG